MNFKTTWVLIVLLIGVGCYFYFAEPRDATHRPGEPPTADRMDEGIALFTVEELSTEAIRRVTIERGDETFIFERQKTDWYQVEPVYFQINGWQLRSIIDQVATVTQFQTLDETASPSFFASVTIANADHAYTLHLGETTVAGRAKLQRENSNALLLVNDALHQRIRNFNVADLRKKTFKTPTPPQTNTFTIEHEGKTLSFYKFDTQWYLDKQHLQRADATKVEPLIDTFGKLSIDQFVEDLPTNLNVFGLDRPSMTLTLTTPDRTIPNAADVEPGERITLKVGRAADLASEFFFAMHSTRDHESQVVFKISAASIDPFNTTPDPWRDPMLFTTSASNVTRFAIDLADRSLRLTREQGDVYTFSDPKKLSVTVDYNAATDLIDAVLGLKADRYDANFVAPDEPAVRVSINDQTIAFYEESEGYWAVDPANSIAYHIHREAVQSILDDATWQKLTAPMSVTKPNESETDVFYTK